MVEFTVLALSARQEIEPFVERACLAGTPAADHLYRLGYKVVGADIVVAAMVIPARLVEEEISSNLALSCRLTPDGDVIPESSFEHSRASSSGVSPLLLDQLVRATLSPQNLHMEEATLANLTTMLRKLEESASIVRDALAPCTERAKEHVIQN
ncbi:hypothetical protein H8A97_41805 [Bradyrhizobium sp. Arg62]|uniref:hypothetical protein n=1 Tax=Bradyrhizobium brasilense TaxID=1419277 RepID=UPI001E644A86|nr:hypothetical protein [Bradyrhizobium brasilense]MCC8951404.1 hypothetical protein [Bradyrhizobium brasilense]